MAEQPTPSRERRLVGHATNRSVRRFVWEFTDAFRSVSFRRSESLVRVVLIGVGVAVATTTFALTDGVLFRSLPYPAAHTLVSIEVERAENGSVSNAREPLPTIADWRRREDLFADLAAYQAGRVARFETPSGDVVVRTARATPRLVPLLTGLPELSQDSTAEPDTMLLTLLPGVVRRMDPGNGAALPGRQYPRPAGGSVAIVAVAPDSFVFPSVHAPVDALEAAADKEIPVTATGLVVGRPALGLSRATLGHALRSTLPSPELWHVAVTPLDSRLTRRVRPVSLAILAAGAILLLACCANLANLQLASRAARLREFQTRLALGATPGAIRRFWALEVICEVLLGTMFGTLVAALTIALLPSVLPELWTVAGPLMFSLRTVLVGLAAGVGLGSIGVLPAICAPIQTKERTAVSSGSLRVRRWRFAALAVQCAVASLLFAAAGVMAASWTVLTGQEIGFDRYVTVTTVSYRPDRGGVPLQQDIEETLDRLRRVPHVESAGAAVGSMLDRLIFPASLSISGQSIGAMTRKHISASYFATVGSQLVAGRLLSASDIGAPVIVVTDAVSRRLGRHPVGEIVEPGGQTIVGVIRDERNRQLDEASPMPTVFELLRAPWASRCELCGQVSYVVRPETTDSGLTQAIRNAIQSVNRHAVVFESSSISHRLATTVSARTFATAVVGVFATSSLAIALFGLASVIALTVRQRLKEVGIRAALGATPWQVLRVVLAETSRAMLVGIVMGAVSSYMAIAAGRHLLYGVAELAIHLAAGALFLVIVMACGAMWAPARKILRISPARALRID